MPTTTAPALVISAIADRVCTLTLNNPDKRNALGYHMVSALRDALTKAIADADIKVIIITGAGKAFCAGADLASLQALQTNTYAQNLEDSQHLSGLFQLIDTCPKPTIAMVQGHALAGGCGLAAVCDFSFVAEDAKMGYTEVKIGFIPALVSVYLIRKIGNGKAKELLLSGNLYSAVDAQGLGLINKVLPSDQLLAYSITFAQNVCRQNSAQSMAATKALMLQVADLDLTSGLHAAAMANATARASEDCKRGIAAFLNKETLSW